MLRSFCSFCLKDVEERPELRRVVLDGQHAKDPIAISVP